MSIWRSVSSYNNFILISQTLSKAVFNTCTISVSYTHLDVYKRQYFSGNPIVTT